MRTISLSAAVRAAALNKKELESSQRHGRSAPLRRNLEIICYADEVIAFWDGLSMAPGLLLRSAESKVRK